MTEFSEQFRAALRKEYAAEATDQQFELWMSKCQNEDLVPVEDVVMQIRDTKEYDPAVGAKVSRKKPIFITTVRALTKIASRSKKYQGKLQTEWIYSDASGNPTIISNVPLADPANPRVPLEPWGARVGVRHADFPDPVVEFARFHAYAQTRRDGGNVYLTSMWASRGPEQIAKCAFAASLRAAFPEAGNLYLREELERMDNEDGEPEKSDPTYVLKHPVTATVAIPTTVHVPTVDHTPVAATVKATEPSAAPPAQTPEEGAAFIANLATSMEEAEKAEADPLPTKEQASAYKAQLLKFDVPREALKGFVLGEAGTDNIKNLTVSQWDAVLGRLELAHAHGTGIFAQIKSGGGN